MNPQSFFADFEQYCRQYADHAMVEKYSRYFKGGYDAWGLTQSLMEEKTKEILARPDFSIPAVIKAAPLFFKSGKYEETAIILSLLNRRLAKLDRPVFDAIESWYPIAIRNWAHADILGMNILPEFLLRGIITAEAFRPWLSSPYSFQRRCVPVTFIKYIKKGNAAAPCVAFIEPLMGDKIREVHQGVGWFLREAWRREPEVVEPFLLKYRDTAPRLIFQYACEKMTKEGKERFRKQKAK